MWERMTGIVVWTNAQASAALVWCDDSGALAWYRQDGDWDLGIGSDVGQSLSTGDLIAFEIRRGDSQRRLRRPQRLDRRAAPALVDRLQAQDAGKPPTLFRDNVVSFRRS